MPLYSKCDSVILTVCDNTHDMFIFAALRLEALVPPTSDNSNPGDALEKIERTRVEAILEDEKGLTTNRKLD